MSAALKSPDHSELVYVRKTGAGPQFSELSLVKLLTDVAAGSGRLAAGSIGTVVHVHEDGAAYEVEFPEPAGTLATIRDQDLVAA